MALPLTSYLTLAKSLHFSELQFTHLYNGAKNTSPVSERSVGSFIQTTSKPGPALSAGIIEMQETPVLVLSEITDLRSLKITDTKVQSKKKGT